MRWDRGVLAAVLLGCGGVVSTPAIAPSGGDLSSPIAH
jgi:hypothetical protein